MTDSNTPGRNRPLRRNWLAGLLPARAARLTSVTDLPPRLLNDIGMNSDALDITFRHRR